MGVVGRKEAQRGEVVGAQWSCPGAPEGKGESMGELAVIAL